MAENTGAPQRPTSTILNPARRWAWLALAWERLWPLVLPAVGVVATFLIVSWMGFWPLMNEAVRLGLVALFAFGFLASLAPLRYFRKPGTIDVDTRIERLSGLVHRPVTAQADVQADVANGNDPFARALWREHQRRMAEGLGNLKSGSPVPKVAARDPFALRALVGLLLVRGAWRGLGQSGRPHRRCFPQSCDP